uniref:Uncharacterized protein n=1 Tax=Anopheles farauti TaxID=69004 RepID=A0A182QHA8_9DIPT
MADHFREFVDDVIKKAKQFKNVPMLCRVAQILDTLASRETKDAAVQTERHLVVNFGNREDTLKAPSSGEKGKVPMEARRFLRSRAPSVDSRVPVVAVKKVIALPTIKEPRQATKSPAPKSPRPSGAHEPAGDEGEKGLLRELVATLKEQLAQARKEKELSDRTSEQLREEVAALNAAVRGLREHMDRWTAETKAKEAELDRLWKELAAEKAFSEFKESQPVQAALNMGQTAWQKEREWQRHQQAQLKKKNKPEKGSAERAQEPPRPQRQPGVGLVAASTTGQGGEWRDVVTGRSRGATGDRALRQQQQQQQQQRAQQADRRHRLPKRRPDAILVVPAPGVSYIEMETKDAAAQTVSAEVMNRTPPPAVRAPSVQQCTMETQTEEPGFNTQTRKGRVPKGPTGEVAATAKKQQSKLAAKKAKKTPQTGKAGGAKEGSVKTPTRVKPSKPVEVATTATYSEMLRGLQADPLLKEVGENVLQTRRAGDGALLLSLKSGADVQAMLAPLSKALEGKATLKAIEPMMTVEIRDIDQDSTAEVVSEALAEIKVDVSPANLPIQNVVTVTEYDFVAAVVEH